MRKTRVMLIANMIGPYCVPLYNFIAKEANFDFKVVALTKKEKNREWDFDGDIIKFDYQILPGWQLFSYGQKRERVIHLNWNVFRTLRQYNPDVIITTGYESIAYWQAFLYSRFYKKKYILWNGTTLLSTGSTKGIRRLLKAVIIKGADRYLAYGTKAKEYLEYFGASPETIHITTNTVDMKYFQDKSFDYRNSTEYLTERKKYPKILLLYVGRLVKQKGVEQVLKALSILRDPDIGFVIVGNGPEAEQLKRFCTENRLRNVFIEGYCQQENLPKYYTLADILILPTFKEVWGLVVNEAMASGLYVICSKYAGAAYDLINNGWNGTLFDPHKDEEVVDLIEQAKREIEAIRARRKDISSYACKEFGIEKSGQAFLHAIDSL